MAPISYRSAIDSMVDEIKSTAAPFDGQRMYKHFHYVPARAPASRGGDAAADVGTAQTADATSEAGIAMI